MCLLLYCMMMCSYMCILSYYYKHRIETADVDSIYCLMRMLS